MGSLKLFTEQQLAKSKSAQATMPNQIANLPDGTRLAIMVDEQGNARTKEWSNNEVVVMCSRTPTGLAMPSAAMLERIDGMIKEGGLSIPEGKELMVTHKRLALVDKA